MKPEMTFREIIDFLNKTAMDIQELNENFKKTSDTIHAELDNLIKSFKENLEMQEK